MVSHADEQITSSLVALRKRHAVGLGELVQEVAALQVLIAEQFHRTTMQEACAVDAAICTIAGVDSLLHGTILGVGFAQLQPCVSSLKLIDSVRLNEKNV